MKCEFHILKINTGRQNKYPHSSVLKKTKLKDTINLLSTNPCHSRPSLAASTMKTF